MNAVQAVHRHIDETCTDEIVAATVKGLIVVYDARWRHTQDRMEIEAMERTYVGPLVNIDTGRKSRTFEVAGKIDKLVRDDDGAMVLYDHKTTSQSIHDPGEIYWRTLQVDSQHQHYELLLWLNGIKLDRIVWDVVRKPTIRPKQMVKAARQRVISQGIYCGENVSAATMQYAANSDRENAELFMLRLADECKGSPDKYFARRSVTRSRPEFEEYCRELWQTAEAMRTASKDGTHFRNSGACLQWNRPCPFLGICSGFDTPDSDNWKRKEQNHKELGIDGDDSHYLTNSRIRTFLTCRRKAYYQYELGIERYDPEEAESLFFGQTFHAALDVYWQLTCGSREVENVHHNAAVAGC